MIHRTFIVSDPQRLGRKGFCPDLKQSTTLDLSQQQIPDSAIKRDYVSRLN